MIKPPKSKKKKAGEKRGPKEEIFSIPMDWENGVKKSFLKKKPKEGWPKQ
jgi:hypothetical protein